MKSKLKVVVDDGLKCFLGFISVNQLEKSFSLGNLWLEGCTINLQLLIMFNKHHNVIGIMQQQ
jgi:hypothetical protein